MTHPTDLDSFLSKLRRTPGEIRGRRQALSFYGLSGAWEYEPRKPASWTPDAVRRALLSIDLVFYSGWFTHALEAVGHPRIAYRLLEHEHPFGGETRCHRVDVRHAVSYEIRISVPWLRRTFPTYREEPPGWMPPRICAFRCEHAYHGLCRILERESARIVSDLLPRLEGATPRTPEEVTELVFVNGWEAI